MIGSLDLTSVSPEVMRRLCRESFRAFLMKAWPHITGGEQISWNWHMDAIAHQLDRVRRGENLRLLVTIPPRNGKSKTISVIWVAWMLGKDPTANFVCVSYSNELSAKMARDCLAILQSAWYRELFPRTIVSPKRSATHDFETTRGGGRLATSIGGTITGRGGDIMIIDDPIKPEEALSETTRKSVNERFSSTLATRLDNKGAGAMLCVMQRLHADDLAGLLIDTGEWHELKLPAIATEDAIIPLNRSRVHHRKEGEVLHPAREPLPVLMALKASMGSMAFSAQYQQDPVPASGNMVSVDWLATFDPATLPRRPGHIVQSWDTASKEGLHNDFSVCVTAHVWQRQVRVLDVFRARLDFVKLKQHVLRLAREHEADVLLIEDAASGQQLIQLLRSEQPPGIPLPIAQRPDADKITRFAGVTPMIEARQLLLPREADWLADFRSEILAFPNGRFDDQADALAQLLAYADRPTFQEPVFDGGYTYEEMAPDDEFDEEPAEDAPLY